MDAGKFSNLNLGNIGRQHQIQKNQGANLEPKTQKVDQAQDPTESVNLGFQPMLQVDPEVLPNDLPNAQQSIIADVNVGKTASSQPTYSLSGPLSLDLMNETQTTSFNTMKGLTGLNGINSPYLQTLSGVTLASATQMTPISAVRMPTTSVTTFGLDSKELVTSSGRVISLSDAKSAPRMPTTSVATNGLDSSVFHFTSGRTASL